jgi:cysteine desulfurase / selenocysteine lyase
MNPATQSAPRRDAEPIPFDPARIRRDFPILEQQVHGRPLVYLDNAATTQKPRAVLEAIAGYYQRDNANVHRGVHLLSERATAAYEGARAKVARFLGASTPGEVIFVRGTTEAVNLVAQTYGRQRVGPGDEVLITAMEHHSNIVPWQMLCRERGARLVVAPVDDNGELVMPELERLIGPRTRLVSVAQVSNVLGTVNPVKRIAELAHAQGAVLLVDGAQGAPHLPVNVGDLGCDFYAFSGHKLFGPTGIGVLYGKAERLEEMPPWQGGGDMILSVTFEETIYNRPPHKFEAGTPNIAGAVGLGAAIDYLGSIDLEGAFAHEHRLLEYATRALEQVPGLRIVGRARQRTGALSFVLEEVHPHDIGTILDRQGIATRSGHHCAQPLMQRYGLTATARASLAFYNTQGEIDALVRGLAKVKEMFR